VTPPAKPPPAGLAEAAKDVLRFVPRLITILDSLARLTRTVERQAEEIDALRMEVAELRAREGELVAKTEAATLRATADMANRLGRIEGRLDAKDA
jgi:regulator of replication initiation timing